MNFQATSLSWLFTNNKANIYILFQARFPKHPNICLSYYLYGAEAQAVSASGYVYYEMRSPQRGQY